MTFTVLQQQRKADLQRGIKLAQYAVRLRFDDLERQPSKKEVKQKKAEMHAEKVAEYKKKKGRKSQMDPDFDSEEEYGKEGDDAASSSSEASSVRSGSALGSHTPTESEESEQEPEPQLADNYIMDQHLIRREAALLCLCMKGFNKRTIIFYNEKVLCKRANSLFAVFGLSAAQVHGNMSMTERVEAIDKFQKGEVDYLLATDLVARGLDIPAVSAVINFSFPNEPKRYLHRIGRTARAGAQGTAITLCNDEERKEIKQLSRKMGQQLNSYMIAPKIIKLCHEFIANQVDPLLREIDLEL